jgi:hypothetical protein
VHLPWWLHERQTFYSAPVEQILRCLKPSTKKKAKMQGNKQKKYFAWLHKSRTSIRSDFIIKKTKQRKKEEEQLTWMGVECTGKAALADTADSVLSATVCITVTAFSGNLNKNERPKGRILHSPTYESLPKEKTS